MFGHFKIAALSVAAILLMAIACTDNRQRTNPLFQPSPEVYLGIPPIEPVADVQYKGQGTETQQMYQSMSGSLFLSGKPYGFADWDVNSNEESPYLSGAYAEQVNTFADQRLVGWTPDNFSSGAITGFQNFVITSGAAGLSVIDVSIPNQMHEVFRNPQQLVSTLGPSGGASGMYQNSYLTFKGMAMHPSLPVLYGFREQDYVSAYQVAGNGSIAPKALFSNYYNPGGTVCCTVGAVTFSGMVIVAFRSHLRVYTPAADGTLGEPYIISNIQAVNIAATQQYLYIQHQAQPTMGAGQASLPSGIYVFDQNGQNISYFNMTPLRFSVTPSNSHIYSNDDNSRIRIYRIQWTN